jgi:hypothetical protein
MDIFSCFFSESVIANRYSIKRAINLLRRRVTMKKFVINVSLCVAAVILMASSAFSQAQTMNYQGYLTENGQPVTGLRDITFSIWNHPDVGLGTQLWEETITNVDVQEGVFSVIMGETNPLSYLVITRSAGYLQIEVDGAGGPISPRTPLTTVPYSIRVQSLDGAMGGEIFGDLNVSGQVISAGQFQNTFRIHHECTTSQGPHPLIATSGLTRYVTGIWISYVNSSIEGNSAYTQFCSFRLVNSAQGTVMVLNAQVGDNAFWSSGHGAPIVVSPGEELSLQSMPQTGFNRNFNVTITGYEF